MDLKTNLLVAALVLPTSRGFSCDSVSSLKVLNIGAFFVPDNSDPSAEGLEVDFNYNSLGFSKTAGFASASLSFYDNQGTIGQTDDKHVQCKISNTIQGNQEEEMNVVCSQTSYNCNGEFEIVRNVFERWPSEITSEFSFFLYGVDMSWSQTFSESNSLLPIEEGIKDSGFFNVTSRKAVYKTFLDNNSGGSVNPTPSPSALSSFPSPASKESKGDSEKYIIGGISGAGLVMLGVLGYALSSKFRRNVEKFVNGAVQVCAGSIEFCRHCFEHLGQGSSIAQTDVYNILSGPKAPETDSH